MKYVLLTKDKKYQTALFRVQMFDSLHKKANQLINWRFSSEDSATEASVDLAFRNNAKLLTLE